MRRVVVVGAGIGGLTVAALLARRGLEVTVLEAHIYPGGCAATFPRQGYAFDAGATLSGGFYPGGPMDLLAQQLDIAWPAVPAERPLQVHLPDGTSVVRWADRERWRRERGDSFGVGGEAFWRWQEEVAEVVWELALRLPAWPPQRAADLPGLAAVGLQTLGRRGFRAARLAADALRPVAGYLRGAPERLRLFVDAQLLIAAQTTSERANALYAAAALDLPHRGVVHLRGGMGAIAQTLAAVVERYGGRVLYRKEAGRIVVEGGRPVAVETLRGESFPADTVVANLTPAGLARLLGDDVPTNLRPSGAPKDAWGAFVVYAGIDGSALAADGPLHHQVVVGRPLGEGNTVFASLSPAWDAGRAPGGRRALTLSTHTRLGPWWELAGRDRAAYLARREEYAERLLAVAERALPGLREAVEVKVPGTPVSFARFTRRDLGWVGGYPQTGLARVRGPRVGPGLWLVGDSIFPGQSTAAVALGGMRVAAAVLAEAETGAGLPLRMRSSEASGGDGIAA